MKSLLLNINWTPKPWPVTWTLPLFQAHRGYWKGGAAENSIEAFFQAKEKGYSMFELDARLSQDHVPVVYHDPHLARFGRSRELIKEFTAQQLKDLFNIPTLKEVLDLKQRPDKINIEIKADQGIQSLLEKKVCDLIKHRADPILISSFNPYAIWFCGQLLPNVPRALLVTQGKDEKGNFFIFRHGLTAPFANPHLLHLDFRDTSLKNILQFTRQNIPVSLWTLNDESLAQDYLRAGAQSIITDSLL